eukprot:364126-Chlamydomonas_euryale.AAC.4
MPCRDLESVGGEGGMKAVVPGLNPLSAGFAGLNAQVASEPFATPPEPLRHGLVQLAHPNRLRGGCSASHAPGNAPRCPPT